MEFRDYLHWTATILVAAFFAWQIPKVLKGRRQRGKRLLDCGGHPQRLLYLFVVVLTLIPAIDAIVIDPTRLSFRILLVLNMVFMSWMGFARLGIYENGVWLYDRLVQWEDIRGYHWPIGNMLRLQGDSRPLSLPLEIPRNRADEARKILEERISTSLTA